MSPCHVIPPTITSFVTRSHDYRLLQHCRIHSVISVSQRSRNTVTTQPESTSTTISLRKQRLRQLSFEIISWITLQKVTEIDCFNTLPLRTLFTLGSLESPYSGLRISDNVIFLSRCYGSVATSEYRLEVAVFEGVGNFRRKFLVEGDVPTNHLCTVR